MCMRMWPLIALIVVGIRTEFASAQTQLLRSSDRPAHQVVAIYFHRTNRCPTCQRIGAYIEEAIKEAYARELKTHVVEWHPMDFENRKNRRLVESYEITNPSLVLLDVHEGQVKQWTPMPKVWNLVGRKKEFFAYVQQGVKVYLKEEEHQ